MFASEGVTQQDVMQAINQQIPSPAAAITISASPIVFTAQAPGVVAINGGVATVVSVTRSGVAYDMNIGVASVPLGTGDKFTMEYTTAPLGLTFLPLF